MALIEIESERTERISSVRTFVNNRQRDFFYNKRTGSHCDGRIDQSVINIDLFDPYVPERNNRGPSLPTALAGITISLTVSRFAHLPSVSIPLALPLVSSALRKRKTNSFPYKWSESLQPRDPVELQIFHLCLGALCYYSSAIIPSLSFDFFFYFLFLLQSHSRLRYSPMLTLTLHTSIPPSIIWSSKTPI